MAATNFTPISLYYSTTASAVPTAANLVPGELAINTADGKLYYEDSSGVVQTLASKAGALGDVVGPASATDNALARFDLTTGKLIQNSVGILSDAGVLTGLTGLTSSGSITLSSLTSGRVTYAGTAGLLQDSSNLTFDGNGNLSLTGTGNSVFTLTGSGGVAKFSFVSAAGTQFISSGVGGSNNMVFAINNTETMRLTSTALGIGTSSPSYPLSVQTSTTSNNRVTGNFYNTGATSTTSFDNWVCRVASNGSGADCSINFTDSVTYNAYIGMNSGKLIFGANTTTPQLTLDTSGNLGIGAASSGAKLDATGTIRSTGNTNPSSGSGAELVFDGTNGTFLAYNRGGSAWLPAQVLGSTAKLIAQTSDVTVSTVASANAIFITNNTERMRIDSSGNLLVGQTSISTTTAGIALQKSQGANIWAMNIAGAASTSSNYAHYVYSTTASAYRFLVDYAGTIFATNTTITAISDVRLKENIRDLDDGLNVIMALKPRKFDWKKGKGKDIKGDRGFIAQEFEQILPDMVENWADTPPEGEEPYKAVNANLIPTLVKAIQDQQALIESLTTRLTALENK